MPGKNQSVEETYAEFLERTGFEDTGENYQMYIGEVFDSDDYY